MDFVAKPVIVKAFQLNMHVSNQPDWVTHDVASGVLTFHSDHWLCEGVRADFGDWYVQDIGIVSEQDFEYRYCQHDPHDINMSHIMSLEQMVKAVHHLNLKWWYDKDGQPIKRNKGEMLMLIVSELSEAMEGDRKNLMDDHLPSFDMETVEIADTLVRLLDYAGGHKKQIASAFYHKLQYNKTRKDHTYEQRAKEGGKRY